ncbi:non-ribosomal peptide synthetase [Pseudomonas chlororaphis]|uniref:Bacitracin synthase 1 n=1 Tax=Pseudomonas chlororaphis TaxID=587753 RepID=A0AAX3FQW7_9PSED|nr:non-ribosomal peptide synthetase [Pseudomonas chlororaphis]AZC38062.1 Peptide synthetase [Pseudomonas chlororaphis subsp. piscium]AZC44608.1 Peptide synthetase [Pseudomonas chlororaphis subsp. piscium]AZC76552.1 Peptide synthetase [Pseudomonas chlororaphis subsp. piscium]WDG70231.1 non-ribosomal peptide synthetase [Pseudomonas chlororaphis]WDH31983.1 non-ribosomal peptide synthetase [Pseudomonas chlororaphis]
MSPTKLESQAFALTAAQRDIWLDQLSRGDSPLYNIGGYVELAGPFSAELIQQAIELLVRKHDALRTVLLPDAGSDGLPLQRFAQSMPVEVPLEDLSAHPEPLAAAQALIRQRMEEPYPFDGGPLFRFFLVRLDARHHLLGTQAHHLILDGWGFGQMLQSLGGIYSALQAGRRPELSAPSYVEFIRDDARYHDSPRYLRDRAYWQDKYRTLPEPLLMPRYRERFAREAAAAGDTPSNNLLQPFPTHLHERMKQWAKTCQASAFHVLLAALYVYFTRTLQRDEWVVGLPILNRSNARFKNTLGLFTQVSAVRFSFSQDLPFGELVRAVRDVLKQDFRHQRFPLSEMNRSLGLLREDRGQLFDLSLSYEQDDHDYRYGEALGHSVKVCNGHEPLPLAIHLRSNSYNDKAWMHYLYNEAYFQGGEIEALAERLVHVLEQGLADTRLPIAEFSLLSARDTAQLQEWNASGRAPACTQPLHARIEAQAAVRPQALAAVCLGQSLTYAELNRKANSLAHHLRLLGVQPDDRVAIVARRGLDTLVGLLAILKAGAAYVPIDPAHPAERLNYLLEDSAPLAVLAQAELLARLPTLSVPVIDLGSDDWREQPQSNPQVPGLTPAHLAYVIYTSGSTGLPKGVMVEHRTLANLVDWHCSAFDLGPGGQTSSLAGFGFDAMAWEVWPALCSGATLHLPPPHDGNEDIEALLDWWRAQPLDVSFLPTPVAEYAFNQRRGHPTLRTLLIGGDRLRQFAEDPGFAVINNYGPTEATVVATSGRVAVGQGLHIGRPIDYTRVYLLDEQRRPVPVGVAGELYVAGAGVARGYLNRPELTAERFLDDPFSDEPVIEGQRARMYRTGDLARWLADGSLEYLGRNDDQVKIRGMRIELGEIESALAALSGVQEAVVQARDGRLLAYFTEQSGPEQPLEINQLHVQLQSRLPDYMLPAAYVRLAALPLTANGKLDRRALPVPGQEAFISRGYEAPQGAVETRLAAIWAELLQVERVGRQDHFFELGGHSLLAVTLVERMRQAGLQADVRVLFDQPTLASLAAAVGGTREVEVPANRIVPDCLRITPDMLVLAQLDQVSIERIVATVPGGVANVQEIYPLAPLQEGLLYHHMTEARDPYQQHAMFAFDSLQRLDAFAQALQQVIARHDILRTSLVWDGLEQPMQVVWRQARLQLEEVLPDPEGGDIAEQLRERLDPGLRPLDLGRAPMMALAYSEDPRNRRWVGMLRFHHLVNDATSTGVLLEEIHAHLQGRAEQLPEAVPYRRYVAQTRLGSRDEEHQAFFREWLADVDEPSLAFGRLERKTEGDEHEKVECQLTPSQSLRLRSQARAQGVSAASVFHLAWALVLGRLCGREDVVFGTVLLGRLQAGAGADRALGMFINTLPLRLDLAGQTAAQAVRETHRRLSALLAHEHAPLALAQRCSGVAAPTPLFNSLLNYRHGQAADGQDLMRDLLGIQLLGSEDILSYPLMLSVDDLDEGFKLSAMAPRSLGPQRLLDTLQTVLDGLVQALEQSPQTALRQLPVLPPAQLHQLLVEFNATEVDYPREQTLHGLFEAQVRRTPDAVALQAGEQQLTYAQLNQRANQLAHHLRDLGVQPDTRVGICVERSLELVIGLLGILKAGGAYVPLDPGYPQERIHYMLQDSAPLAVLVHGATRELLAESPARLIDFDRCDWQQQPVDDPLVPGLNVTHLAYVIYTSGSTGLPKGVMIEHRGLGNLMHWGSQICPDAQQGALLQRAPFSFDGSVWELFWPLTNGMRLVLARPDGHREPAYLAQTIREQGITVIKFVPALLQQFLELDEVSQCRSLTDVFSGGGELTAAMARRFQQLLPQARLHNVYGPTEATVDSTAWTLEPGAPVPDIQLPIGRPIGNTRLYVLDEHDRPVPLGVSGHLHIGGVGVARGYLGLPQLQAERFIDSPFVAGDRLYRSGDLVRYRADGCLEFLGRNDFQVKLRGLRVELGEIEARLASHSALREVVVLMRDERLVAYFTLRDAATAPGIEGLRGHLLAQVPEYMVPSAFVQLEALPLSPNGKLDRKALPAPGQDAVLSRSFEAPQGEVETALAQIWAEVLKIERVGRHDHFFELGGHSLLAVSLVARMRQAGLNADARVLFSQPTLAELAAKTVGHVQRLAIPATTIPTLNRKRRL